MRAIKQSKDAKRAMIEIYAYTKNSWGKSQADNYAKQLYEALKKLANNPNIGHMRPDILTDYFSYACGSHLVIYRADNNLLYVIAVLHQAMNIGARIESILHYKGRK